MRKVKFIALIFVIAAASAWAATIRVTAPAAGAVLCKDRTYSITWDSSGVSGPVMVWLMQGRIVAAYLTWSTDNDGRFDYTVAARVPTGEYTMAVISRNDRSVRGESGAFRIDPCTFTPAPPPPMEIAPMIRVFPESADVKVTGIIRVRWTTRGRVPDVVEISIHREPACADHGILLSTANTSAGEKYVYIPLYVTPENYYMRIGEPGSSLFGRSSPLLIGYEYNVVRPTRSSACYRGDSMVVRWGSRTSGGVVDIGIVRASTVASGGRSPDYCLAESTANDGEERVTIPAGLAPGQYRIWVCSQVCPVGIPARGSFSEPFTVSAR